MTNLTVREGPYSLPFPLPISVMVSFAMQGRITDGQGKTVECREAIFIMTSNVANEEIAAHALKLRREAETAKQHREAADTGKNITKKKNKNSKMFFR